MSRSAGSIRLNADAVKELNTLRKEEALAIIDVQKEADQLEYDRLQANLVNLTDAEREQLDILQQNIDSYDIYIAQIEEAYSAFSDFERAKQSSNQGQKQRTMESARDTIQEGLASKRTGTDDYKTAVQLYVPDSVKRENPEKVKAYLDSISKYMNGNEESTLAFLEEARTKGLLTKDSLTKDFQLNGDVTLEEFAEKMKMTEEMIQALLGEASEFEYDIVLKDSTNILPTPEKVQQQIDELASSLEDSGIQLSADISFSTMNADELQENIGLLQSDRSNYSVDSSEYQQINDLIAIAIERKQQLSEPAVMSGKEWQATLTDIETNCMIKNC